jgi:hypothetical protein
VGEAGGGEEGGFKQNNFFIIDHQQNIGIYKSIRVIKLKNLLQLLQIPYKNLKRNKQKKTHVYQR